jgi:hypothetical protein
MVRKFRILLVEVVCLGILIGWFMWKYPELIDPIIPWVALLVAWHLTWEFLLDAEWLRTFAGKAKGKYPRMIWIGAFFVGGLISIGYLVGIKSGLNGLAEASARIRKEEDKSPAQPPSVTTTPRFGDSSNVFTVSFGGNQCAIRPGENAILLGGGNGSFRAIGFSDEPIILSAYIKDGKLVVDAILRGETRLIANVLQNTDINWDRNFDDSAFEVVDDKGVPMLQVVYMTPNTVSVYGVFQGKRTYFAFPGGITFNFNSKSFPSVDGYPLKPIFKYPSRKYQGQEIVATRTDSKKALPASGEAEESKEEHTKSQTSSDPAVTPSSLATFSNSALRAMATDIVARMRAQWKDYNDKDTEYDSQYTFYSRSGKNDEAKTANYQRNLLREAFARNSKPILEERDNLQTEIFRRIGEQPNGFYGGSLEANARYLENLAKRLGQ